MQAYNDYRLYKQRTDVPQKYFRGYPVSDEFAKELEADGMQLEERTDGDWFFNTWGDCE